MKIGELNIRSQVFLAPMAGYTDLPFRLLCKKMGAGIVYTEFVSSEGLIRGSEKTETYLISVDDERPVGVQIFGHNPIAMAEAAKYVEEKFSPDLIDINFGCSVRKVVKKNAGAALLKDLDLLGKIAEKTVKAVSIPVTAKIRAGWTHDKIVAVDVAKILEDKGVKAIAVHPRTASDGFGNKPNLKIIADVKNTVKIPVIGNGDIKNPEDARKMMNETNCDAVMIGRGAIGNPWIFKNIIDHFAGKETKLPCISDKIEMCIEHLNLEISHRGENFANRVMKKAYGSYFKGFPQAEKLRQKLVLTNSVAESLDILYKLKETYSKDFELPI